MIFFIELTSIVFRFRYLKLIFVSPSHQNLGIGSQMVAWGTSQADKASPPLPTYLEASPHGQKVYERKGFEIVGWGELDDDVSPNGKITWPCMMRKGGWKPAEEN